MSLGELARAAPDHLVPCGQAPSYPGAHSDAVQPDSARPPPNVAAQRPLRDRRDPLAGRDLHGMGRRELQGDLAARVRGSNHQYLARWEGLRVVAHHETGLAGADHDHVQDICHEDTDA